MSHQKPPPQDGGYAEGSRIRPAPTSTIHDLRHAWLRDVGKPGEFGLVADFPRLNESVESNRQSHQSSHPWNAARLCFVCRTATLDSTSPSRALSEVDLLFDCDHAASPTALSASVLWRSVCKADPLREIYRRVKWTHRSWLAMLEAFDLQDRGEGCSRWTITDGYGVLIETA